MENTLKKELQKTKDAVYRYLEMRNRSEKEIRTKLNKKKFSPETIEKTIQNFKDIDLINDVRFTEEWIRSRLNKPLGKSRIYQELMEKGIKKETFTNTWAKLEEIIQEEERIEPLARKRSLRYKDLDPIKRKKRLFDYLLRRGFSMDSIKKVIQKL